jgi:hypothetical protein
LSSPNDSSERWNFLNKKSENLQEYWKKMEQTEERLAHLGSERVPATEKSNGNHATGSVRIKLVLLMILVASVFFIGYLLLLNGMGKLSFDYE